MAGAASAALSAVLEEEQEAGGGDGGGVAWLVTGRAIVKAFGLDWIGGKGRATGGLLLCHRVAVAAMTLPVLVGG